MAYSSSSNAPLGGSSSFFPKSLCCFLKLDPSNTLSERLYFPLSSASTNLMILSRVHSVSGVANTFLLIFSSPKRFSLLLEVLDPAVKNSNGSLQTGNSLLVLIPQLKLSKKSLKANLRSSKLQLFTLDCLPNLISQRSRQFKKMHNFKLKKYLTFI